MDTITSEAAQARAQIREWLAVPHLGEYLLTMTEQALEEFSRVREFPLDVARAAYEREMGHREGANAEAAASSTATAHVQLPNHLLGRLLDQGRASAYAVHLLAIKMTKGPGFVLNNKHLEKNYGISDHGFRKRGLPVLKRSGVLDRQQSGGREFATETLAETARGDRYVAISDALLTQDSDLVALILAIKLAPHAASPLHFAGRIGIKSPKTVKRLLAAMDELKRSGVDLGIQTREGPRNKIEIGRDGAKFTQVADDLGKNDRGKNDPGKNRPTHRKQEELTVDVRRSQKQKGSPPLTPQDRGERVAGNVFVNSEVVWHPAFTLSILALRMLLRAVRT